MTYAIRAQFESEFPAADYTSWLRTSEGIAGWWSDSVTGSATEVGDVFHVAFPTTPVTFDVRVNATGDGVVEWSIDESPPWWRGTTIRFDLTDADQGSMLMFTHDGFEPDDPIIPVITPAWVRFLDNLVEVARRGVPNPAVRN